MEDKDVNNTEERPNVTWNRIWEELDHAKTIHETLLWYTDRARKRNRYLNNTRLLIAILGTVVYKWFDLSAYIATLIITILEILKDYFPTFFQSEEELSILDKQITFYSLYLNDLEKNYSDANDNYITRLELGTEFRKCKQKECEHIAVVNKYIWHIPSSIEVIIHNRTDEYLKMLKY